MHRLLAIVWCLTFCSAALAQHPGDIEIGLEAGRLVVEPGPEGWLFESEFPQPPDPLAYFTDEPGFEVEDGTLAPGGQIGAEVLSHLLFWNGSSVVAAPGGVALAIDQGPTRLYALAGAGPLGSFLFATADAAGGLHNHLDFFLLEEDLGGPGGLILGGPLGAYGLHLRLVSPPHAPSEPLLIAFNNGLADDDFAEAARALALHAGVPVPEPACLELAALGGLALALRRLFLGRRPA